MAGVGLLTCPNEVLDQIMAYLFGNHDLWSMCLVSRVTRGPASQRLYHSLSVLDPRNPGYVGFPRALRLLSTSASLGKIRKLDVNHKGLRNTVIVHEALLEVLQRIPEDQLQRFNYNLLHYHLSEAERLALWERQGALENLQLRLSQVQRLLEQNPDVMRGMRSLKDLVLYLDSDNIIGINRLLLGLDTNKITRLQLENCDEWGSYRAFNPVLDSRTLLESFVNLSYLKIASVRFSFKAPSSRTVMRHLKTLQVIFCCGVAVFLNGLSTPNLENVLITREIIWVSQAIDVMNAISGWIRRCRILQNIHLEYPFQCVRPNSILQNLADSLTTASPTLKTIFFENWIDDNVSENHESLHDRSLFELAKGCRNLELLGAKMRIEGFQKQCIDAATKLPDLKMLVMYRQEFDDVEHAVPLSLLDSIADGIFKSLDDRSSLKVVVIRDLHKEKHYFGGQPSVGASRISCAKASLYLPAFWDSLFYKHWVSKRLRAVHEIS